MLKGKLKISRQETKKNLIKVELVHAHAKNPKANIERKWFWIFSWRSFFVNPDTTLR